MKKNKTAVEWLVTELNQKIDYIPMKYWDEIRDLVQQAKQMEKQQIMTAWAHGVLAQNDMTGEQYYNETYGKE